MRIALAFLIILAVSGIASAELIAVSQLGYHPDQYKQSISYTSEPNGTFSIIDSNDQEVYTGKLYQATDYRENPVNCQGNNPCLVAEFTDFNTPGDYVVTTSLGGTSPVFTISNNTHASLMPLFTEFFNALKQQNSDYHQDMHTGYEVDFFAMADGSYIMEADQASLSLIRLANAYRVNPDLIEPFLPTIKEYTQYLLDLQGRQTQVTEDGTFRLGSTFRNNYAFTPGVPPQDTVDLYIPGSPPEYLETIEVVSLCDDDQTCIDYAAEFYKCQEGEICLDRTYIGEQGEILSERSGWGVSRGWGYEFACEYDYRPNEQAFIDEANPCMIFYPDTKQAYTVEMLHATSLALPALYDYDQTFAEETLQRLINTLAYYDSTYEAFDQVDDNAGFLGAALFALYDATGNQTYLTRAHDMRAYVSQSLISDRTRGNEFYWQSYVEHKTSMQDAALEYPVDGVNPEEYFRGKMFFDYKDNGPRSISNNAERMFEFDPNIQFQNSRYILTEGVMAAKAIDLHPEAPPFSAEIADQQLAWLTGQNGIQEGTGTNAPIRSFSFIAGVGEFPDEQHTRLLLNTGYRESTDGEVVGTRGTNTQWYNGSHYLYLDGRTELMGYVFGSSGNGLNNETPARRFNLDMTYENGKDYIPGWISGSFDTIFDQDVIHNFRDSTGTYENTETTNEIIATAIELAAYRDMELNGGAKRGAQLIGNPQPQQSTLNIDVSPEDSTVHLNGEALGQGDTTVVVAAGSYVIESFFENQTTNTSTTLYAGQTNTFQLIITPPTEPVCVESVHNAPATCEGVITSDEQQGVCRSVRCESTDGSVQILACDKDGFFEMYRQETSGIIPEICLDGTCIQENGYAKSDAFEVCEAQPAEITSITLVDAAGVQADIELEQNDMINLYNYPQGFFVEVEAQNELAVEFYYGDEAYEYYEPPYSEFFWPNQTGYFDLRITAGSELGNDHIPLDLYLIYDEPEEITNLYLYDPSGNTIDVLLADNTVVSRADYGATIGLRAESNANEVTLHIGADENTDSSAPFEIQANTPTGDILMSASTGDSTLAYTITFAEENACYQTVFDVPATCEGGTITTDESNGCRTIVCESASSSLQILACNKPGNFEPEFFEMYRQSETGSGLDICIGETCIGNRGYAKSDGFSCGVADTFSNVVVEDLAQEKPDITLANGEYEYPDGMRFVVDSKQDVTFTLSGFESFTDNSAPYEYEVTPEAGDYTLTVQSGTTTKTFTFILGEEQPAQEVTPVLAPWYPQGTHVVLICESDGASSYDWDFGDGAQQYGRSQDDVYHIYPSTGNYDVTCVADGVAGSATITI